MCLSLFDKDTRECVRADNDALPAEPVAFAQSPVLRDVYIATTEMVSWVGWCCCVVIVARATHTLVRTPKAQRTRVHTPCIHSADTRNRWANLNPNTRPTLLVTHAHTIHLQTYRVRESEDSLNLFLIGLLLLIGTLVFGCASYVWMRYAATKANKVRVVS